MDLIKIGAAEIGVKEHKGADHNPRIVQYAKEAGFKSITDDETPWCSIFVNWCCQQAGLMRTHKANARSWLSVGTPVTDPHPGDVVIFWRESPTSWKGHVGLFMGYSSDKSMIFTLGGNQRDTVSIQGYSTEMLLGFRRLSPQKSVSLPNPVIKKGDRGSKVRELQNVLTEMNCSHGSSDGVFGPMTETALKKLQKQLGLQADGIYGQQTKEKLNSIFMS